jgi:hypothetical protein
MSLPSQEMSDFIRLAASPQRSIDPDQISRGSAKMAVGNPKIAQDQCPPVCLAAFARPAP